MPEREKVLSDSWISEELLIQSAESAELESEPFVAAAIEDARRQILLEAYLMQITQDIEQPSSLEMINYAGTWEDTYCKVSVSAPYSPT